MKLRKKLKSSKGFSLVEYLIAMLILALMSSVACMGISNALQNRAQAITVADAQSVASTAAQAVADQVRYGRVSAVGADHIDLSSNTYGSRVRLQLDGDGHLVAQSVDGAGVPVGAPYALLGEMAYHGLAVDTLKFEKHETGGELDWVDISLSVGDGLWSLQWSVAPLNPRAVT